MNDASDSFNLDRVLPELVHDEAAQAEVVVASPWIMCPRPVLRYHVDQPCASVRHDTSIVVTKIMWPNLSVNGSKKDNMQVHDALSFLMYTHFHSLAACLITVGKCIVFAYEYPSSWQGG